MQSIERIEHRISGQEDVQLAVRVVRLVDRSHHSRSVVLIHGARAGGVASFDLPVAGGSLAYDLASAGCQVFVMDARGYGASDWPPTMYEPAEHNPPAVRSVEVVNDLTTVVEWVCQHGDVEQVALLGWATGGHWTGYYAGLHPERVSHLVLYNTLYGGTADHPSLGRGSSLDDPDRPGQFNRSATGAWRVADAASLLGSWDRSIPVEALDDWRDPAIASAYVEAAISSARHRGHAEVDALKHPTGALEDSFYLAIGRQLWDASFIRARTLVIRSERDFWSRAADAVLLADHLVDAASVEAVTIPGATHFVHLDRPERGRQEFVDAVVAFLATP